ncbi:PDZ domain-containing protein, partial [Nocardioides sp. GCM10030258]|uniref:PDZ domain-containing protein n=1 Tax=unclassified Nocardioides TaxID=2615069 RepID=UPI00360AAAF8
FIFAGVFATYGNVSDKVTETTIDEVHACVVPPSEDGRACTAEEVAESPTPAYAAGIRKGDRIVSFNGTQVGSWNQMQDLVRANKGDKATIVIERDGVEQTIITNTTVTPRFLESGDTEAKEVGFLGVSPERHARTGGVFYTIGQMGHMTVDVATSLATLPEKVWGVAKAIVGIEERDPLGPVSIVGGGRLAGEV